MGRQAGLGQELVRLGRSCGDASAWWRRGKLEAVPAPNRPAAASQRMEQRQAEKARAEFDTICAQWFSIHQRFQEVDHRIFQHQLASEKLNKEYQQRIEAATKDIQDQKGALRSALTTVENNLVEKQQLLNQREAEMQTYLKRAEDDF